MKSLWVLSVFLLSLNAMAARMRHDGYVMACDWIARDEAVALLAQNGCANASYIGVLQTGNYASGDQKEAVSILHYNCADENNSGAYVLKMKYEVLGEGYNAQCIQKEQTMWRWDNLEQSYSYGFELPCDQAAIDAAVIDAGLTECFNLDVFGVLSTGEKDGQIETLVHYKCLDSNNRNFYIMRETFDSSCTKVSNKGWIWDRPNQYFKEM